MEGGNFRFQWTQESRRQNFEQEIISTYDNYTYNRYGPTLIIHATINCVGQEIEVGTAFQNNHKLKLLALLIVHYSMKKKERA